MYKFWYKTIQINAETLDLRIEIKIIESNKQVSSLREKSVVEKKGNAKRISWKGAKIN